MQWEGRKPYLQSQRIISLATNISKFMAFNASSISYKYVISVVTILSPAFQNVFEKCT